jgi:hypothetical protein
VSTLLVAGSWWLFQWELANGASLAEARTAALNVFVVVDSDVGGLVVDAFEQWRAPVLAVGVSELR